MPDTSMVFKAEIEAINYACQFAPAHLHEYSIK